MTLVIIKNSKRTACSNCGGVHDYITKPTPEHPCDTPVAYPSERASATARLLARGDEDIERITTGTRVVLAEGARNLPFQPEPGLATFTRRERFA